MIYCGYLLNMYIFFLCLYKYICFKYLFLFYKCLKFLCLYGYKKKMYIFGKYLRYIINI